MHGEPVFVVTMTAVYDHGVYLVTTDRSVAEDFCATTKPDHDGHHSWRIDELPLNVSKPFDPSDNDY